jgi:hypothetical protein
LVEQIVREVELFHTPSGDAYATARVNRYYETLRIEGQRFKDWLGGRQYMLNGKALSSYTLTAAVNTLRALALAGPEKEVVLRYAQYQGKLYVDLGNDAREVVEISPDGWRVTTATPVRFVRTPGMRAMPKPQAGGRIEDLRPFLNVKSDRDFYLLVGFGIAAMNPAGPFPVLMVLGEHGSAKSTTVRLLRDLIDPTEPPHRAPPREERDLVASARANWLIAFDNVSHLSGAIADAICRLATGSGYAARKLYTDGDEYTVAVKRPVVVNSINPTSYRGDLLDRAIMVELPGILPERRRDERTFWEEWSSVYPRILGALFTALSVGMRDRDTVRLRMPPRMADAALWVTACEAGLGWPEGTFAAALASQAAEVIELPVYDSSVGSLVVELANDGPWTGTATELLETLRDRAGPGDGAFLDGLSPVELGHRLKAIEPNLRAMGVELSYLRTPARRERTITRVAVPEVA